MNGRLVLMAFLVFLLAFGLRFYDLSYPNFKWMDEQGHVPAAANYWNNGQFEPDNWEHPPLRHVILQGFLAVFGDNPYGWRMRNVLFGSLAAVLTFLLALEVSGSGKNALLAGLLLATDPLHIVLSRYTFCEIYGSAFFLASVLLFVRHEQRSSRLVLSALFMGLAISTKWNYVPGWVLLYVLALKQDKNYRDLSKALFITCACVVLPLTLYLTSFYPWFGRGYSLGEFAEFLSNIYHSFQLYQPQSYDPDLVFLSHTSAWEWFVRPIMVGQGTYIGPDRGEFILFMNNMPIWILLLPAVIGMCILAVRKGSLRWAVPSLFFCVSYALFLLVRRPAFLYSTAPLLPFAFIAVAQSISSVTHKWGMRILYTAMVCAVAWNAYLYPLVTAKKINVAAYRFLLDNAQIKMHQ